MRLLSAASRGLPSFLYASSIMANDVQHAGRKRLLVCSVTKSRYKHHQY
jgi:hypothetical protein